MKIAKYITWFICFLALAYLAKTQGFQNGSAYIQFIDGAVMAFGLGVYIGERKEVKRFLRNHKNLHQDVQELKEHMKSLHEKHDELHHKISRMENHK